MGKSLRKLGSTCVRYIAKIAPRPAIKILKFLASIFQKWTEFPTDFYRSDPFQFVITMAWLSDPKSHKIKWFPRIEFFPSNSERAEESIYLGDFVFSSTLRPTRGSVVCTETVVCQ